MTLRLVPAQPNASSTLTAYSCHGAVTWPIKAAAAALIGQVTAPWQLYAVDALLAFGWAGTTLGIITNTLGLWFDKKRGMAISLALNGASFGGIAGVPLLVVAINRFGFSGAMIVSALAMILVTIPVILAFVGRPPRH